MRDLYKAIKAYSESDEAKNLSGFKAKFVKETVKDLERNGFALSAEDREKLKAIKDEISTIGNEFNKNIATYQDHLIIKEEDMTGLSDDYKKTYKQEDGTYKIDLSYPSYRPFMKYAEKESLRKQLYIKYLNRASEKNLDVLEKLITKRQEMANLLGYETYAAYRVADRMAKTTEKVWNFEKELRQKIKPKAIKDYDKLLSLKRSIDNNNGTSDRTTIEEPAILNAWESSFYSNLLLEKEYKVDAEEVKEHFPLKNVIEGLFKITGNLFDLEYKEIPNPSVWHEDVKAFEVFDKGALKGRFYLDLHPRTDKYNHAACFPIISGKKSSEGYQIPTAALVCNFSIPTGDKPALMTHSEVNTFFHEFGHVLHHLLTTTELSAQAGFSVARDFVEAPSQIFENWTWSYESLKLFAKHYESGEVLSEELYKKMLKTKNVGSGLRTLRQIFYGTLDFTLYDKYTPNGEKTTTDVVKELQNTIMLYPYVQNTHFQAAFGHLNGYGAGYYGYLWSKVYAQDMFSVFEENGILDPKTGKRYKDIILAKGNSEEELDLVHQFLQREPNDAAFLKSLDL